MRTPHQSAAGLLLRLAYDGTGLAGAAWLPDRPTVAGAVADALARCGLRAEAVDVLCRTDAGVHARGQVAWADLGGRVVDPADAWRRLARHLPPTVRCLATAWGPAPVAADKTYAYTLDTSAAGDPFAARFAWRPARPVDPAVLDALAPRWCGRRDLVAFARRGDHRTDHAVHVLASSWRHGPGRSVYTVRADRFSFRGVRAMVGAMVRVAQGSAEVAALDRALGGRTDALTRETAPARGLCLDAVTLADDVAWWSPVVVPEGGEEALEAGGSVRARGVEDGDGRDAVGSEAAVVRP